MSPHVYCPAGGKVILEFRLDRHARTQLELKLDYQLRPKVRKQEYFVEAHIFVPVSLCLTKQNYTRQRFYSDTAAFIRMSAPVLPLSELSNKTAVKPWASDIKAEIEAFADGTGGNVELVRHNLKLLGCVFKRAVRDARLEIRDKVRASLETPDHSLDAKLLSQFAEDMRTALRRLRKVGERSEQTGIPEKVRVAWRAVDEYSALIAEEALTDLVVSVEPLVNTPELRESTDELRDLAIAQYIHRRDNGYESYAVEGAHNEYLAHRWRVLKRYISSALYLGLSREKTGGVLTKVIAMGAAGMAMLFATLALLFIQSLWAASVSTAFITAMVMSYIIKDQIKDVAKKVGGKATDRYLPDHLLKILGANDTNIGQCTEAFEVRTVSKIPRNILDLRYSELDSHEAVEGRPETVLRYQKRVTLSSKALRSQFVGATGLTDVIRLNMQPMLTRMDDPTEIYRYLHPRTKEVVETRCARVYRVNVILTLTTDDGNSSMHRVRVVLDKKGIKRVEVVSNDPTHHMVANLDDELQTVQMDTE